MRLADTEKCASVDCPEALETVNGNDGHEGKGDTSRRLAQIAPIRAGGIARESGLMIRVCRGRGKDLAARSDRTACAFANISPMSFLLPLMPPRAAACRTCVCRLRIRASVTPRIAGLPQSRRHVSRRAGDQVRQQADSGYEASTRTRHDFSFCVACTDFATCTAYRPGGQLGSIQLAGNQKTSTRHPSA